MTTIRLQRFPDGTLMDWGRNWRMFGMEGYGPARSYYGEAAEVIEMVLKHTKGSSNANN